MTGTTGEAPTLSDDERFALYEVAVDEIGSTHTVVAGTGTYDTAHSVHLTERAHEIGVHGFLVVTPYYNKPPQRGIVAHVETIAAVTDRPVVFYDIPSRVVVDAEPATISALAAIANVTRRQAGEAVARRGAPRRRLRGSTSTLGTTISSIRSSRSAASAGSASTRTSSARR